MPCLKFDIKECFESETLSILKPQKKTQTNFYVWYENNCQVLRDERVFGVLYNAHFCTLILENVQSKILNNQIAFGVHFHKINTVLVSEQHNCILAGDEGGRIVQYVLDGTTGKIIRDFGVVGIGQVRTCAKIGNLVAFGGDGTVIFFDIAQGKFISDTIPVAIGLVFSLLFCPIKFPGNSPKILLIVSGDMQNYFSLTDVLDVTHCFGLLGLKAMYFN